MEGALRMPGEVDLRELGELLEQGVDGVVDHSAARRGVRRGAVHTGAVDTTPREAGADRDRVVVDRHDAVLAEPVAAEKRSQVSDVRT
jgi:hypothetical protein